MILPVFEYGQKEIEYLSGKDPLLAKAINTIGKINRPVIPDPFSALIKSIVGQQISTKAQLTIWARIKEKCSPLNSESLAKLGLEEIQSLGMSTRKASYIKGIAEAIRNGSLDLDSFASMNDEEVCKSLVKFKGIGLWTAEMLLLFSLQRPDVLSYGDLAIHRGLRMLYRHKKITAELHSKYKRRYTPYASTASLYLWAIAGGAIPELCDPAAKASKMGSKQA